jgi:hypothetical protein
MGALEILQVHPLGQVLGGAYAARHSFISMLYFNNALSQ